jgi:hypothetical protein
VLLRPFSVSFSSICIFLSVHSFEDTDGSAGVSCIKYNPRLYKKYNYSCAHKTELESAKRRVPPPQIFSPDPSSIMGPLVALRDNGSTFMVGNSVCVCVCFV